MRMNDAFPSKYLRAEDLEEGDLIATISEAVYEEFTDPQTKRVEQKVVLHFQGDTKPMVLNKTNWRTIAGLLGTDEADDWTGKKIMLYATEVESFGQMVLGIRVRLKAPAKAAAAPSQAARQQATKPQSARNTQSAPADPYGESLDDGPPF